MAHPLMRLLVLAAGCWLGGQIGCSLSYPTDRPQCVSSRDCLSLAETRPELQGSSCRDGVCAVNAGQAGQGAAMGEAQCTRHFDCVTAHGGDPYVCRQGACVDLRSGDCGLVLRADELNHHDEVILLGAFAGWNHASTDNSPSLASYRLALDEFANTVEGVPSATGEPRPFVVVVCQGENLENLTESVHHLTTTLDVTALLAALPAEALYDQFDRVWQTTKTFFLSPNSSNNALATMKDDGRLWHMLGQASDLAPGYQALANAVIEQIAEEQEQEPVRVALVVNNLGAMTDMADSLVGTLRFNGKTLPENREDGNYVRLSIPSALLSSGAYTGGLLGELRTFAPHVILALAGSEFIDAVVNPLESMVGAVRGWEALKWAAPPRYVMSQYAYNQPLLRTLLEANPGFARRIVGVNFAAAVDQSLNEQYFERLADPTYNAGAEHGYENFYDAAYFAMLSVAAVGQGVSDISGVEAAGAMKRLVKQGGIAKDIKPSLLTEIVRDLSEGDEMYLTGALGPPEFDTDTGTRVGEATVWCMTMAGTTAKFVSDKVRYDRDALAFVGPDGGVGDPLTACSEVP